MDEDRFPSRWPSHGGHRHHPKPTRLIVFFIENETIPQEINDQLDLIYHSAASIYYAFLNKFGPNVSAHLKNFAERQLREIVQFSDFIRREVISMTTTPIKPPTGAVNQLLLTDTVGILVAVLEADDSGLIFFPPVGPLQYSVSDPAGTVTQGVAADGVTPTFLPNGSGKTGDVTVEVTDSGNNLVNRASFSVVGATPPPAATQIGVFFVPNAPAATGATSGQSGDAPAAAAAAPQANDAGQVIIDPHHPAVK